MIQRLRLKLASACEALDEWATKPDRFQNRVEALRAEKKRRDQQ